MIIHECKEEKIMFITKKLLVLMGLLAGLALVLSACGGAVETVIVEVPGEVIVVTATPAPEVVEPGVITDFADVPDDVLVRVCEDVKSAVEYDDEARTLTLHLAAPFGPTMQLLSNGWASPLDQEWMVEQGDWDGECSTWVPYHDIAAEDSPIFNIENGTGPFTLDYWNPGQELSGLRWDGYWRTEPMWEGGPSGVAWYDRVVEQTVDEWGTRFAMLQAGDVDIAYVPKQYLEQVEPLVAEECDYITGECVAGPGDQLRLYKDMPGVVGIDFFFSMDVPPESAFIGSAKLDGAGIPPDFMADVNIRKAFASCFDYETFLRDVEKGEAIMRNGPIIAGMTGYDANDPPTPVFDLEACEAYFKAADSDHDGVPAGEDDDDVWSTGFFMMLAYNTGNDQRRVAAELLKANVESINENFNIDVLALPWPAYLKQHRAGFLPIYRIGWLEDYHHPHNWVQPYLSAAGAYGGSLALPEAEQALFDSMIAEAKSLTDPTEQHEAYKAIQRKATELQTGIWGPQATGRRWEPLWMEGYFRNPAFSCPFVYGYTESDASPHPKTYIEASIGDPETLDPAYMYDTSSSCWIWRFYDPLVHLKRESFEEFIGQLADTWEISDDGLTYTFHIREGVKFHEGGDLDAHDAAYAIWRGLLQDRAGGPQWMFWDAFFGYETVEGYAIDMAN
jgi:peptide/nickel transport system substrate-binding protein